MKKITHFKTLTTSALALAIFAGGALPTFAAETTTPTTTTPSTVTTTSLPSSDTLTGVVKDANTVTTTTAPSPGTTSTPEKEQSAWVDMVKGHTLKAQKEKLLKEKSNAYAPLNNPDGSLAEGKGAELSHAEALKSNPLHFTNVYSNMLIMDAISKGDWSQYDSYQAMRSPLFYNMVDGKFVKNKFYYVHLMEAKVRGINEDITDKKPAEIIADQQRGLKEMIADFNKAPGDLIPYIVGVNHLGFLAKENGIAEPSKEFFNSPYNDSYVLANGKYRDKETGTISFYEKDALTDPNNNAVPATTTNAKTVEEALKEKGVVPIVTPVPVPVTTPSATTDKAVTPATPATTDKATTPETTPATPDATVPAVEKEKEATPALSTSDSTWLDLINATKK